jgi:hypothetical protein
MGVTDRFVTVPGNQVGRLAGSAKPVQRQDSIDLLDLFGNKRPNLDDDQAETATGTRWTELLQ